MRNKVFTGNEDGQALTELVCVLPLLLCVIFIILFMAGTGLSNIRAVKEARSNAEAKAVNTARSADGTAVYSWKYNGIVPFSAKDTITGKNPLSASITVEDALDNPAWSEYDREVKYYQYRKYSELQGVDEVRKGCFAAKPEMFRAAAELVQGRADEKNNGNFFYRRWRRNEIQNYELNFSRFFSVRINDLDIARQRANTVYFPALK